jgi:hypothetical protein
MDAVLPTKTIIELRDDVFRNARSGVLQEFGDFRKVLDHHLMSENFMMGEVDDMIEVSDDYKPADGEDWSWVVDNITIKIYRDGTMTTEERVALYRGDMKVGDVGTGKKRTFNAAEEFAKYNFSEDYEKAKSWIYRMLGSEEIMDILLKGGESRIFMGFFKSFRDLPDLVESHTDSGWEQIRNRDDGDLKRITSDAEFFDQRNRELWILDNFQCCRGNDLGAGSIFDVRSKGSAYMLREMDNPSYGGIGYSIESSVPALNYTTKRLKRTTQSGDLTLMTIPTQAIKAFCNDTAVTMNESFRLDANQSATITWDGGNIELFVPGDAYNESVDLVFEKLDISGCMLDAHMFDTKIDMSGLGPFISEGMSNVSISWDASEQLEPPIDLVFYWLIDAISLRDLVALLEGLYAASA